MGKTKHRVGKIDKVTATNMTLLIAGGRGMLPPALDLIRGKRGEGVGSRIAIRPEWSAGRRECPRKLLYPIS